MSLNYFKGEGNQPTTFCLYDRGLSEKKIQKIYEKKLL